MAVGSLDGPGEEGVRKVARLRHLKEKQAVKDHMVEAE